MNTCVDNNVRQFLPVTILPSSLIPYYQGGIIDEDEETITYRLATVIQHIAGLFTLQFSLVQHTHVLVSEATFPDSHKATEDLRGFAKLNEKRLYKLMKTCMDPQTDLKNLVKATVSAPPLSHEKRLMYFRLCRTSSYAASTNPPLPSPQP